MYVFNLLYLLVLLSLFLTRDDMKTDFYVGTRGRLESPEQHFYYQCWCLMGYDPDKNPRKLKAYILNLREKYGVNSDEFPYKRVVSESTIAKWKKEFEWELRDAHRNYEQSLGLTDEVNEYNNYMIREEMKQNKALNNAINALQNIITSLTIRLDPTEISMIVTLTKLGYLYNTLSMLKANKTLHINNINEYVTSWVGVKEQIQLHHNELNTDPDNLQTQFDAIDYYFDNYATE